MEMLIEHMIGLNLKLDIENWLDDDEDEEDESV